MSKALGLVEKISRLAEGKKKLRIMEVCGTHTVAIFRSGIRQLLPKNVELVSGPGCPVCVTNDDYIDKAVEYSRRKDFIVATFGDMLKVPGSRSSLTEAIAQGACERKSSQADNFFGSGFRDDGTDGSGNGLGGESSRDKKFVHVVGAKVGSACVEVFVGRRGGQGRRFFIAGACGCDYRRGCL